ncbi:MAG: transcription-repair coupling factor, partial [Acidobacteria bacterium]|nr:transcription-repair coupling factor [Acidobacteriota bacterium]
MAYLSTLLQKLLHHPEVERARQQLVSAPPHQASLGGLTAPAKALALATLAHKVRRPFVVITADNPTADHLAKTAAAAMGWLGGCEGAAVGVFPAADSTPYEGRSPHSEIAERRAVALLNIARGVTRLLFVPLPAALGRFREGSYYSSLLLDLKAGEEVLLQDLTEHLDSVGYEASEPVTAPGQYSVRGGIVDVFPPEAPLPSRLEFLGDTIESIREFDPSTQRSRHPQTMVRILPFSEHRRSAKLFTSLVETLSARCTAKRGGPDWHVEYSAPFPGWEFFVPLVEPHRRTLFSLLEKPVVVWDEPVERTGQLQKTLEMLSGAYEEVRDVVPPRPSPQEIYLTEPEFLKALESLPALYLRELAIENPTGGPTGSLSTQPPPKFHGGVKSMVEELKQRRARGETILVVLPTAGKVDRLREILKEYEVPFELDEAGAPAQAASTPPPVIIARGELDEGVVFPELGVALLSDSDLFGEFIWGTHGRREKSVATIFISDLSDLKPGDYVVHIDHGIGQYQGLRPLEVDGARRDFMLLMFQEDARLYVPLERLDLVEKYRAGGEGGAKPQLDRLGGATWARTKTRVKRALRDIAQDLLRLYAERKMHPGTAFSADTPWQKEFEDSFEFEETPDQITALTDIKRDLESPQPMDRLLCGDVGYGKTEMAMRAAFKVVQDGKQVVLLAPTTVLAFQHCSTFQRRFAAFPMRIEMLSRFRSLAEQKAVVADAGAGRVDILIGTHRLLSKDVHMRDLGLLVVDEEQRFGVAAKEKLKKLKASVDVLTLSATPIPRTLHMSLGGLRDLSVIETPPRGRLAIQTVVTPFSDALVQSAIMQELARQGQVYFVHNRVETIWSIASIIQRLVPTARIGVSHGQMGEKELERVMLKFMEGGSDVLVSTALIENGLDIPRANTMIVNRADRFGLADLYQLRGRVGRSDRPAYAYFLIPDEETLTPIAKRRLAALKEFSGLGAGFRLAALDLELRGAGNLLGAEQSGEMSAIGFDLYLRMLEQTVDELRGAPPKIEVRTTLNLGLDIKIPEGYIADESQRLRMYKRIAGMSKPTERDDMHGELEDRFGPVPSSVENLLHYALLKAVAEQLRVQSIERKAEEVWLRFHPEALVDTAR